MLTKTKASGTLFLSLSTAISMFFVCVSVRSEEAGFKPIFNGKSLDGWEGDESFWSVENGALCGQSTEEVPAEKNTFIMWREGVLDDFELRLSYKVIGGNSGIQYRSRELENGLVAGYQADIESGDKWTGVLYDEHGRGVLADRGQKTVIASDGKRKVKRFARSQKLMEKVRKGDWNQYTVIAQGNHLIHKINGQVMSEVIDDEPAENDRSGILALQIHSGPPMTVKFKNIRLKRLPLQDKKKVVMVAGRQSHGKGTHEHNAGVLLLKHCLDEFDKTLNAAYLNGWPEDPTAFDNADTIMLFMDGGGGHPINRANRYNKIDNLMKQGTGLAVLHYAVAVPKKRGGKKMQEWIGGYYESNYSANPTWLAKFTALPDHPVTRGVKPFELYDEWYFNMRFRPEMRGVIPLLKAVPPDKLRKTKAARQFPGREEIVAWCVERSDGGRGFGFTGGHFHNNWGNGNFRKIVLNALLWTAHVEVPENGVASKVTDAMLKKNLD